MIWLEPLNIISTQVPLCCEEDGDPICLLSAVYGTQGQKRTPVETIFLLQGRMSASEAREAMAVVGKGGDITGLKKQFC